MKQRIIKFRAWHKELEEMVLRNASFKALMLTEPKGDAKDVKKYMKEDWEKHLVWQQFTGLKDKNGKEIYEGDMVRGQFFASLGYQTERILEVRFRDGSFCAYTHTEQSTKSDENNYKPFYGAKPEALEIIGNVWENPELLSKD